MRCCKILIRCRELAIALIKLKNYGSTKNWSHLILRQKHFFYLLQIRRSEQWALLVVVFTKMSDNFRWIFSKKFTSWQLACIISHTISAVSKNHGDTCYTVLKISTCPSRIMWSFIVDQRRIVRFTVDPLYFIVFILDTNP